MTTQSTHKNTPHRNVYYISLSFFLVFSGVNSCLVFGTSDYGDYAAISLAILYISFALSALFIVPSILNNKILSPKYCAFFGSLVEILFISEYIIFINQYYLYFISIIQGIGISMYWVGAQRYIVKCANHYEQQNSLKKDTSISKFQGIFFCAYQSSTFVSNLLSAILFVLNLSNAIVYTFFTILCCLGCAIILFADNFQDDTSQSQNTDVIHDDTFENKSDRSNISHSILSTIKMWKNPRMQCLLGMYIYLGLYIEYEFGLFPTLIASDSMKFFVMAIYGISGGLFSKLFAVLSTKINKWYIISIGLLINIFVYIFIFNIGDNTNTNVLYLFIIAILNGIIESSLFITLFTLYPIICGDNSEATANTQFFQQFGLALGYFLFSFLGFNSKIFYNVIALFIAAFIFYKSKIVRKYMNYKTNNLLILNDNTKENYDAISVSVIPIIFGDSLKEDYVIDHGLESDGYESTYSEISV
eukprot:444147_1